MIELIAVAAIASLIAGLMVATAALKSMERESIRHNAEVRELVSALMQCHGEKQ